VNIVPTATLAKTKLPAFQLLSSHLVLADWTNLILHQLLSLPASRSTAAVLATFHDFTVAAASRPARSPSQKTMSSATRRARKASTQNVVNLTAPSARCRDNKRQAKLNGFVSSITKATSGIVFVTSLACLSFVKSLHFASLTYPPN